MGIIDEYVDMTGKEIRRTSDATRIALLRVMGLDARNEAAARRTLERLDAEERLALVAPTSVVRTDDRGAGMRIRVNDGARWAEWSIVMTDEQGLATTAEGRAPVANGMVTIAYPPELEAGYYDLRVTIRAAGTSREGHQRLIVTPGQCPSPETLLAGRRVFGLTVNLYTVHGNPSWGIGNLGDLRSLAEWGGEIGAAFVGVNPLHALFNRGTDISPYSPVTRLFRNPLYLDIGAIPELHESPEARALLDSRGMRAVRADLQVTDGVQYERIAAAFDPVLRALHATFLERRESTGRGERYRQYVDAQGEPLENFAVFMALDAHLAKGSGVARTPVPWPEWPKRYRDPRSPAVADFRAANGREIDFHRYIQFELDCQLATAADAARAGGMPIGLYQDLAIGTSPSGSDLWAFPDLFLQGASIGAPPDPLATLGQNWGLPPIDPRRLAYDGYRYWIQLLRSSFRHSGALRIDHVMGLFRQFWIPDGETGKGGAYVRFPSHELLGILALESSRAGALVVGEDLGTVPPEVPPALKERNILSSRVLYFERTDRGGFKPAKSYAPLSLATANTHDLPTLAGWWEGRDITLRNAVGQLGRKGKGETDRDVVLARAEREREKAALLRRLVADGALPHARQTTTGTELRAAVHEFLCISPAALVGISLDDIVGEREPVNLPGVGMEDFPSWTRRLRVTVDDLRSDSTFTESLGCAARRGSP
jgi:4-alpha-glucanotransferase